MRYYPISKDPSFYIEELNDWEKHETCDERIASKIRRDNNFCGGTNPCPPFYHPMLNRKKGLTKKQRKRIKKTKLTKIYNKEYDEKEIVNVKYWNDIEGSKIETIRNKDLQFDDWSTTRIKPGAYLPIFSTARYIKCTTRPPGQFTSANIPISLDCVRQTQTIEAYQRKMARLKAFCEKEAAILKKGIHTDGIFHKLRRGVDEVNKATRQINHDTI